MNLEIEVKRVFDLEVEALEGGRIYFSNLKPNAPPQFKEVTIKVNNNAARAYQVIQSIPFPLTNEKGDTVPSEYFTARAELLQGQTGQVRLTNFRPIKPKEEVIFNSDSQGSSSSFKVIYNLKIPPDFHAGSYSTGINYSLVER